MYQGYPEIQDNVKIRTHKAYNRLTKNYPDDISENTAILCFTHKLILDRFTEIICGHNESEHGRYCDISAQIINGKEKIAEMVNCSGFE